MELSKKIKQIRNDNKLTQEQFAEKMLVSRTAVSKWENGTCYPSIDSLKYMSKIFNVSLDKLLSSEEILEIAKTENQSNISKYNSLLSFLICLIFLLNSIVITTLTNYYLFYYTIRKADLIVDLLVKLQFIFWIFFCTNSIFHT